MSKSITMRVKGNSFRKLDDPFLDSESKKYVFYVKIGDIATDIPMATNPREQNVKTSVAKSIQDSLVSEDRHFHLLNRGIVLSAETVKYNNRLEEVTITFADDEIHGNIDGGHTYKICCANKDANLNQYVQFEVMTGVEKIILDLADARNTSVQVDDKSLAELANKFEPIKDALDGMPFYSRIAFKQNQITLDNDSGKKQKMIDARDVVAILGMFDTEKYNCDHHPTQAYSSKAGMLAAYLENIDAYRKFINVAPEIFDLYDAIETEFPEAYNSTGGKYGGWKFSSFDKGNVIGKSKFGGRDLYYRVPEGMLYPVVGAFRQLLTFDSNGLYKWTKDPYSVWTSCKKTLTEKIMDLLASPGTNPNSLGKKSLAWDYAYLALQRYDNK